MLIELKERSDVAIRSQVESYLSMADNDYRNIIDHICDEKRYRAADDEDVRRYDRLLHDMGASDKNAHSVNAPWNCQHPSSQKTPKILTAADQAARTESMLLSR